MSTLVRLYLLLAALSTLVSSQTTSSPAIPTVYNNCSGHNLLPLPNNTASAPFFKPQIHPNPLDNNNTSWEEWFFIFYNILPDGSALVYGYKWSLGDPASPSVPNATFSAWAYFPNGTFYLQVVNEAFKHEEYDDGGFALSIADNHLAWDPVHDSWNTSVNANGWIIEMRTANVEPGIPFVPNYNSTPGQISKDLFSRIEVPRAHSDGFMHFPWGFNLTIQSVGTLKHTWSNKLISDTISAYVRGSTSLPNIPPNPIATLNWYQTWDLSGKQIDSMQFLIQPDDSPEGQVLRIQIADAPEVLSIVTTPKPTSLPLSYNNTELTLPMCGPGVDFESTDQKMRWKTTNVQTIHRFVDSAGGITLYQTVDIAGIVWVNGTSREVAGGIGVVEVYHRG